MRYYKDKDPFQIDLEFPETKPKKPLDWEESAVDSLSSVEGFAQKTSTSSQQWLKWVLWAMFLVIGSRIFYLQAVEGEYFRQISENNRLRSQVILTPRGLIKDRRGEVLAKNLASYNLVAIPFGLSRNELDVQLAKLATVVDFDIAVAKQKILNANPSSLDPVVIEQDIPVEQGILFETKTSEFTGFSVQKIPVRDYINPESLFHIVGYAGLISQEEFSKLNPEIYSSIDFIGKSGVEQSYESYLHGENGFTQVEVDAQGNLISKLGTKDPAPGNTLILNLDKGLQDLLYKELAGPSGRRRAAAVAMNPKTGEVLALVSTPGLDGSKFARGFTTEEYQKILSDPALPLFNRTLFGTYPPGSTVKPMNAIAALEEKVIHEDTVYNDTGVLVIPNQFDPSIDYNFYGWKRTGLGKVDVRQAIALSSDIFFYIVAGGYPSQDLPGLGIDRLAAYYRKFNLGRLTGIDLPGEKPGLVPDAEWKDQYYNHDPILGKWYLGDTYHAGIGQGDLLVTPLQMAEWISIIANRGVGMQPQVLKKVLKGDSDTVLFEQKPKVLVERFAEAKNIKIAQEGMRETVVSGTARSLNTLPITSAGKTGTSQFDGSDPKRTHAWFTAYAPYEDPQIVIVVLVEAGGEGSSVSVPVVRDALAWWAKNRYNE